MIYDGVVVGGVYGISLTMYELVYMMEKTSLKSFVREFQANSPSPPRQAKVQVKPSISTATTDVIHQRRLPY